MLLYKASSLQVAEVELVAAGKVPGPIGGSAQARRQQLLGVLRNLANEPHVLEQVVNALYAQGMFSQTEVNAAMDYLLDGLT